jgi:hypothetical protein
MARATGPGDIYAWNSVEVTNTTTQSGAADGYGEELANVLGSISCRNTGPATRAVVRKIVLRR